MSKPHVILLPGLLTDARLYAAQCDALADVAETRVADLTLDDSLGAMARRVLAQAPARFSLAGLSMGGYLAFEIIRQAPDRVERLALLDTTARPDTPEQTERRLAGIELARQGRLAEVIDGLLPLLLHPDHLGRDDIGGLARRMAETVGADGFVRQQTAIRLRPDSRPSLSSIACPTLVVVGRQDALTPPDRAAEMAEGISGARLEVIEHCGHLSTIEQPARVAAVLRSWLHA